MTVRNLALSGELTVILFIKYPEDLGAGVAYELGVVSSVTIIMFASSL